MTTEPKNIRDSQSSSFRGGGRAFTLIETMVALVAFGIILAAINGVFWGAMKLRNRSAETIDAMLPVEQAMGIIRKDLANIVPPGGTFLGQFQTTQTITNTTSLSAMDLNQSRQGRTSPQFFTSSGVVSDATGWSDVQQVSYELVMATNRNNLGMNLVRNVTRNLLPAATTEVEQQPILSGVESIFFYYADGTTWRETWDSTTETYKLPKAVKVEITMATEQRGRGRAPAPLELIVPLIDAGTNNLTVATQ